MARGLTRKQLIAEYNRNFIDMIENYRISDVHYSIYGETAEKISQIIGRVFYSEDRDTGRITINRGSVSRLKKSDLKDLVKIQRDFNKNAFTSREGRQAIIDNAYSGFLRNKGLSKDEVSQEKFLMLIDIVNGSTFQKLRDIKELPSKFIVDLLRYGDKDDIQEILEKYMNDVNINQYSRTRLERKLEREVKKLASRR